MHRRRGVLVALSALALLAGCRVDTRPLHVETATAAPLPPLPPLPPPPPPPRHAFDGGPQGPVECFTVGMGLAGALWLTLSFILRQSR